MNNSNYTEQLFNTIMQLRKLVFQKAYSSHKERVATMLQLSALNFLKEQSGVTVGDLAQFLQLSKSSATQLTERLVKVRLVKRISDKRDRRCIHLTVTQKGEAELMALKKKVMEKMNRFLSKLPEEDIKELIRIHTNLIEDLKKEPV